MGVFPIEATFSEYRKFDGLLVPVKSVIKVATQERVISVDSLQHNVDFPADRFEPPAEINAFGRRNRPRRQR